MDSTIILSRLAGIVWRIDWGWNQLDPVEEVRSAATDRGATVSAQAGSSLHTSARILAGIIDITREQNPLIHDF